MKKTLCASIAMCFAALCWGQLPQVASVERVALPGGTDVSMAALSPDGSYAVVSPLSGVGLSKLDFATSEITEISKTASPLLLDFTADSRNVIFRESSYDKNHRRLVALKSYDVSAKKIQTIVEPTRRLQGFAADGTTAVAVDNGRMRSKAIGQKTPVTRAVLSIDLGKLCVTRNGKTEAIAPLGDRCNSYLWPSLSPDGKRIVAFGVGTGAFTCNLDGSDVRLLGMYRAPKWLDNNVIVAMDDHDNGVVTVRSAIMAIAADGSDKAALTADSVVAVFPSVAKNKVGFTTPQGEFYIINLK